MDRYEVRRLVLDALATAVPTKTPAILSRTHSIRDQLEVDADEWRRFVAALNRTFALEVPDAALADLVTLDSTVDYFASRLQP